MLPKPNNTVLEVQILVCFLVSGGIGVLWSVIWFAIIYDSPTTHPRISQQEKDYLIKSIGLDKPKPKV